MQHNFNALQFFSGPALFRSFTDKGLQNWNGNGGSVIRLQETNWIPGSYQWTSMQEYLLTKKKWTNPSYPLTAPVTSIPHRSMTGFRRYRKNRGRYFTSQQWWPTGASSPGSAVLPPGRTQCPPEIPQWQSTSFLLACNDGWAHGWANPAIPCKKEWTVLSLSSFFP